MKRTVIAIGVLFLSVLGLHALADQLDLNLQRSMQLAKGGETGGGNGRGGIPRY